MQKANIAVTVEGETPCRKDVDVAALFFGLGFKGQRMIKDEDEDMQLCSRVNMTVSC